MTIAEIPKYSYSLFSLYYCIIDLLGYNYCCDILDWMVRMDNQTRENTSFMGVLTGDIVRSSSLDNDRRKKLFDSLLELSILLEDNYSNDIVEKLSKFRGDSWQLLIKNPGKCLEISLFIRTYIRYKFKTEKLDSRIGIAIGSVDYIPKQNISEGFGAAYTISGELLDSLKKTRMSIRIESGLENKYSPFLTSLTNATDAIITSWTAAQCQVVFWSLQKMTQTQISERWQPAPIAQSSVAKHLKAAQWYYIKETLAVFESSMNLLVN